MLLADSYLSVPVHHQLSENLLSKDGEFTIAAWFQSLTVGGAVSGTVLSLSATNSSFASYSLGFLQLHNRTTTIKFSLQVTTAPMFIAVTNTMPV